LERALNEAGSTGEETCDLAVSGVRPIFLLFVISYPTHREWNAIVSSLLTTFPKLQSEAMAACDVQV